MMDQRGRRRLAVGPSDPDHAVRRKLWPGQGKQFDIANHRHTRGGRVGGNRMGVKRHAGRDDHAGKSCQVNAERIGQFNPAFKGAARFLAPIPGGDLRPARQQAFHRSHARAGKAEDGIALTGKGGGGDHRSLSVDKPIRARTIETIQKRITTVDSFQPNCSKWWWIGAILNTRLPVRL